MVEVNVRRLSSHLYYHSFWSSAGVDYSRVEVYQRMLGGMYERARSFAMPMAPYFDYYDTSYENVVLPYDLEDDDEKSSDKSAGGNKRGLVDGRVSARITGPSFRRAS